MLSITESKKILNKNGLNYSDEEINKIREFIYVLAEIDYEIFMRHLQEEKEKQNSDDVKIIPINNNQNTINDEKERDTLHQGEYRRAS
ncbi:MAG TPA: hypothetical protein VNZ49_09110 [Bacteroidia bacterium]|jgi:hypothetical protein|nr:hypothetical protein [Bacteroidia bacterium]